MSSPAKPKTDFSTLLGKIRKDFPEVSFERAEMFSWSAERNIIFYDDSSDDPVWSLLHELGHMKRGHTTYSTDSALIRMEVEAWASAKDIAIDYGQEIDEDHIQDCLDSYRNWQHKRSSCPVCTQTGAQKPDGQYRCINCGHLWKVTFNRFCRVYRRSK